MQVDEQESQILLGLGLSGLQVKVYLALAKMDTATPKKLSSATKIDRANIYRIITQLEKLELVEKMIMTPTQFKALPVDEAIRMLLEFRDAQYLQFKAKTKEVLEKYKPDSRQDFEVADCQFALVPDGKFTEHKVKEMLNSNEKTHDILIYWRDCASNVEIVMEQWEYLLHKGVRIRAIVYFMESEKLPQEILNLKKYGKKFELRSTSTPPKATICIIDGKQSFISVNPKLTPPGNPGLWINNPTITSLIQEYFDLAWRRVRNSVL